MESRLRFLGYELNNFTELLVVYLLILNRLVVSREMQMVPIILVKN